MAESQATSSFGILLQMGDGAEPEAFATIAEVRDITPPAIQATTEEVTHHTSPGAFLEKIATMLSLGDVTFMVNWLPADPTHDPTDGLIGAALGRIRKNWKIVFPDADSTTWAFMGFVTNFTPSGAVSGVLTGDITIEPTGMPTIGAP